MLFEGKSVHYDGIDPLKCFLKLLMFISKGFKRTLCMCLLIIGILWLLYFNYVNFKRQPLTEGQLNISAIRIETGTELRNEV